MNKIIDDISKWSIEKCEEFFMDAFENDIQLIYDKLADALSREVFINGLVYG